MDAYFIEKKCKVANIFQFSATSFVFFFPGFRQDVGLLTLWEDTKIQLIFFKFYQENNFGFHGLYLLFPVLIW